MILRRLAAAVRRQDWFTVLVETMIVVLGVFLGLQANNWNEARQLRQQERQALQDIATDLEADLTEMKVGQQYALQRLGAVHYVQEQAGRESTRAVLVPDIDVDDLFGAGLLRVPDAPAPPAENRDRLWSIIILAYYPTRATAAFDALLGAGELNVIRDKTLIRELQIYRQLVDGLDGTQNMSFRSIRNNAIEVGHDYGLSAYGRMDEEDFVALVAENDRLSATINTAGETALFQYLLLAPVIARAETLRDNINARLEDGQ